MPLQKSYTIKVFDQTGSTLIKNIPATQIKDRAPSFRSVINGGLGQCVLDLNLPFDDFDEGLSIDFINIVDIYAVDEENPRGRRIYRGYLSRYEPYLVGRSEGVRITLLGLVSLLSKSYYGTATDYTEAHVADDPEDIAKDIIDNFNSIFSGSLISYSGTTSTVGTNVTKTITEKKWVEALNEVKDLAGPGWWWKVDADGFFHFKAKPVSATHTLTIDKDILSLSCPKDSEKVLNHVIVKRQGGTATEYPDPTSQATFGTGNPATGRYTKIINDSTIADEATADQRGEKELDDNSSAKVKATVVVGPEYDLEFLKVGETVKIRNFKYASSFFSDNMQIYELTYAGDTVTLQLEEHGANFGIELDAFVNE